MTMTGRARLSGVIALCASVASGDRSETPPASQDLAAASAQDSWTPRIGAEAPAFNVGSWLKGEEVDSLERGTVYVVEFWATWCGPCIAEMPLLSRIERSYADEGLAVIGVNVWEEKVREESAEDRLARVRAFVESQGDRMSYRVAFEGPGQPMSPWYQRAENGKGIPFCAVIDQRGVVAWHGHPVWLVEVAERVVRGTWDSATDPAKFAADDAALNGIFDKIMGGQVAAAKDAWEQFQNDHPAVAVEMGRFLFPLFLQVGESEVAYAAARRVVDRAALDGASDVLNAVAWGIVDPTRPVAARDLDLALEAASAAAALSAHADPSLLDTLARVYFLRGEMSLAVAVQERAVSISDASGQRDELLKTLKSYRAALPN